MFKKDEEKPWRYMWLWGMIVKQSRASDCGKVNETLGNSVFERMQEIEWECSKWKQFEEIKYSYKEVYFS